MTEDSAVQLKSQTTQLDFDGDYDDHDDHDADAFWWCDPRTTPFEDLHGQTVSPRARRRSKQAAWRSTQTRPIERERCSPIPGRRPARSTRRAAHVLDIGTNHYHSRHQDHQEQRADEAVRPALQLGSDSRAVSNPGDFRGFVLDDGPAAAADTAAPSTYVHGTEASVTVVLHARHGIPVHPCVDIGDLDFGLAFRTAKAAEVEEYEEKTAEDIEPLPRAKSRIALLHQIPSDVLEQSLMFLSGRTLASLTRVSPPFSRNGHCTRAAQARCYQLEGRVAQTLAPWCRRLELVECLRLTRSPTLHAAVKDMINLQLQGGRLRLVGAELGDEGAVVLAKAMRACPEPLVLVNLSGNGIGDEGAIAIAGALRYHSKSLRAFCIARNQIGSAGTRAISHSVARCPDLGVLYLAANPLHRVPVREDTGPRPGSRPIPSATSEPNEPAFVESPTCVAIAEELLMRADAKAFAAVAHSWTQERKYSSLLPAATSWCDATFAARGNAAAEEAQGGSEVNEVSELDGVEALIATVKQNESLCTLSVRATGIAACFAQDIRDAWGDRCPTGLYL